MKLLILCSSILHKNITKIQFANGNEFCSVKREIIRVL